MTAEAFGFAELLRNPTGRLVRFLARRPPEES